VPGGYRDLWAWSVEDVGRFWAALWRFFDVEGDFDRVLEDDRMPGTR
jgi:acetoacetyl-CoA synthetase